MSSRIHDRQVAQFCTEVARPKRFELLTPRFVVWCSIQLSYGRVFRRKHLRALADRCRVHSENILQIAKARHSYRLRGGLARSGAPAFDGRLALESDSTE